MFLVQNIRKRAFAFGERLMRLDISVGNGRKSMTSDGGKRLFTKSFRPHRGSSVQGRQEKSIRFSSCPDDRFSLYSRDFLRCPAQSGSVQWFAFSPFSPLFSSFRSLKPQGRWWFTTSTSGREMRYSSSRLTVKPCSSTRVNPTVLQKNIWTRSAFKPSIF